MNILGKVPRPSRSVFVEGQEAVDQQQDKIPAGEKGEVGTNSKLGAQTEVPGVAGTWRELTDNVNMLASNLTNQVRNIAEVTTAVTNGDLTHKITVEAKGELLQLKDNINKIVLRLYVTGQTPKSERAIANIKSICENELARQHELVVIDVLERPQLAEDEKILATPTLVKMLPLPLARVIGDLSDTAKVLIGLNIEPSQKSNNKGGLKK